MRYLNKSLILLLFLFTTCKKEENLQIKVQNSSEINFNDYVIIDIINKDTVFRKIEINNKDTLNMSSEFNLYYKMYNCFFKEIHYDTIDFTGDNYFLPGEYDIHERYTNESKNSFISYNLENNDTLRLKLYLSDIYYDTPLSFLTYELAPKRNYYISFFYQSINNKKEKEVFQSDYYILMK